MDLVSCVKRIVVVMAFTDKFGQPKLLRNSDLPVTGQKCVSRLITDHGVFDFRNGKVVLQEVSETSSVEYIKSVLDCDLEIPDDLAIMEECSSSYVGEDDDDIFA